MRILADCCANHCGKRSLMAEMIQQAANVGVDVVKWQSWKADKLRKDWPDYEESYAYYKQHELSEKDHHYIIKECKKHQIEPLFSVFDLGTVDFLCQITDTVKIPSPDANNWELIDKCLVNFKHVLISVGMHSSEEVADLAEHLRGVEDKVTILHCVSLYPTPPDKVNMIRLASLMQVFPSVGFSDHTMGVDAGKLALSLGVACLEKHFTLDRTLPGRDQAMSATLDEFAELVRWRDAVQEMMYNPGFHDEAARKYIGKWTNED